MKKLLLVSTALLLLAPDIAQAQQQTRPAPGAQPPSHGGPGRPGGSGGPGRPGGSGRPEVKPVRPPRPGGPQIQPSRPGRPDRPQPGNGNRPRPPQNGNRPRPPQPGHGARPPARPGAGRPPQFRPIHGPSFRYPRGYRYRRWTIGLLLPSLFLSSAYYYDNYYDMGLGAPPYGYRWVRYGPDLLLVDTRTGRIGDVIYGAFY